MTRKIKFYKDEYFHIYNRGTDKRKIFMEKGDLYYFFDSIIIANQSGTLSSTLRGKKKKEIKEKIKENEKIVEIIAYCLLPNHFHFIIKELKEGGISLFMKKLGISYVNFFNKKYNRSGSLFQGRFKASKILNLEKTSVYVNLNYKHHKINHDNSLMKTSLFEYLGTEKGEKICSQDEIQKIIKLSGELKSYKKTLKLFSKMFSEDHKNNSDLLDFSELEN